MSLGSVTSVGTWAKDRDCLWNIAKKPDIYGDAFKWPKIWQKNRDQIKNPDIIHPGQVLKIPAPAPLTPEEESAARKYYRQKREAEMNATTTTANATTGSAVATPYEANPTPIPITIRMKRRSIESP